MAPGDRRRRSHSQLPVDSSEVEVPSLIFVASPTPVSEGPALAGPNEPGTSEADLNKVGPIDINYYTLYIIKFDSFVWIILTIYLLLFQVSLHRWSGEGEVHRRTSL